MCQDPLRTIDHLRDVARHARTHHATEKVVGALCEALVICEQLPATPEFLRLTNEIRLELRRPLLNLGRANEAKDLLSVAVKVADVLREQKQVAWIYSHLAHVSWLLGEMSIADEHGNRALAIAEALDAGDSDTEALKANTLFRLGKIYHSQAAYAHSVDKFLACLNRLPFATPSLLTIRGHAESNVRTWIVWSCGELGRFREGVQHGERAVMLASKPPLEMSEGERAYTLAFSLLGLGTLRLWQGESILALDLLERAHTIVSNTLDAVLVPRVLSSLGAAYSLIGANVSSLPLLERAVADARLPSDCSPGSDSIVFTHRSAMGPSGWLARLGEAYLQIGRRVEAREIALRALKVASDHSELGYVAWAKKLMGDIAATEDPPDAERAKNYFYEARETAIGLGMAPLSSLCDFALAGLSLKNRDNKEAAILFAKAQASFNSMDMIHWAGKCTRELARLAT
jgi:tetratricopeptide (TPR) repeat protein